jgi:hypothetical protein
MTQEGGRILDFEVRRDNLRISRCVAGAAPDRIALERGQALFKIDKFALTANNVTYAALGDAMAYWNFFPAADAQWGRVPAWGLADVVASNAPGVAAGERFYGYFPMSSHVVLQPEQPGSAGFVDGAPHRKQLNAVYNRYARTSTDPGYDAAREAQQVLLKPLFITSFLIDDFLADNECFGAATVVLSSASSKTAYGTAFMLSRRKELEVIGLTSAANLDFVQGLGCYDQALPYDRLAELDSENPVVYVDLAGDLALRRQLHEHYGMYLRYSCAVGGTHWEATAGGAALPRGDDADGENGENGRRESMPGARPILFFAPAQIKKRHAEWGAAGLQQRVAGAWRAFMTPVCDPQKPWLQVIEAAGSAALERAYLQLLEGKARPQEGYVLSL